MLLRNPLEKVHMQGLVGKSKLPEVVQQISGRAERAPCTFLLHAGTPRVSQINQHANPRDSKDILDKAQTADCLGGSSQGLFLHLSLENGFREALTEGKDSGW